MYSPLTQLGDRYRAQSVLTLDCNSAGSEQTFIGLPAKYRVLSLNAYDATGTPVLAQAGLYTATGGGGTTIVTAATMTALTAATKWLALTLAAITGTDYLTANTLFLRCTVAQGSALTIKFVLIIHELE